MQHWLDKVCSAIRHLITQNHMFLKKFVIKFVGSSFDPFKIL